MSSGVGTRTVEGRAVAASSRRRVGAAEANNALEVWAQLGLQRVGIVGRCPRVGPARQPHRQPGTYVALVETLDCPLLTADARLAGAPRIRYEITLVRQ